MASVLDVWRYPVKSMAGERLDSCQVSETGLVGDRRWALVDGSPNRAGNPMTIRENEQLLTYRARLGGRGVEVVTPGGEVVGMDGVLVSRLAAESSRPLTLRELEGANFDDSPVLLVNLASVAAFGVTAPDLLRVPPQPLQTGMGVYCRVPRPGRVAAGDHVDLV